MSSDVAILCVECGQPVQCAVIVESGGVRTGGVAGAFPVRKTFCSIYCSVNHLPSRVDVGERFLILKLFWLTGVTRGMAGRIETLLQSKSVSLSETLCMLEELRHDLIEQSIDAARCAGLSGAATAPPVDLQCSDCGGLLSVRGRCPSCDTTE